MTEIIQFESENDKEESSPVVNTPMDQRPDLDELGIIEIEKGVCEDTFENRQILRKALLRWDPVYDSSGNITPYISARTLDQQKQRALLSLDKKKSLLLDPGNNNSDFLTGLDLLLSDEAIKIVPPWVLNATRLWQKEQEAGGPPSAKRKPLAHPVRCRAIKTDGLRCQQWSSGRPNDDSLCMTHLKTGRITSEMVDKARKKIQQAAGYAVDTLEELMSDAISEPVRLKAATEILDRAGVRGGVEIDVGVDISGERPAHVIVAERLERLAAAKAMSTAQELVQEGVVTEEVYEITNVQPKLQREDGSDPDARN